MVSLRKPIALAALPAAALFLMALDLPENPPVPEQRPEASTAQPGSAAAPEKADAATETGDAAKAEGAEAGKPADEAPEAAAEGEDADKSSADEEAIEKVEEDLPDDPPLPEERADNPPPPPPADPKPAKEDAEAFNRCTAELMKLGTAFKVLDTIDGPGICGIDRPLEVTMVIKGVELSPAGTMRCETALALANWAKDYVNPTAKVALSKDAELKRINQASTYICRSRNNVEGAKVSEHAKGNAIDIASLTFSDGTVVDMEPRMTDGTATGAFQRTVSAATCLYFKTVLAPGSDATHQDHMHLDVIDRKGGYRYCR